MYRTYTKNDCGNHDKNHFDCDCCNSSVGYDCDDYYYDWDDYEMGFDPYMGCYSDDC